MRVDDVNMIYAADSGHIYQMTRMADRLRQSRQAAGLTSARAAAMRHGWTISTYAAHENGQNDFDEKAAAKYARAYKVSAGWLLTGEKAAPVNGERVGVDPAEARVVIQELCRRAGMSDNAADVAAGQLLSALTDREEHAPDRRIDDLRAVTRHIAREFSR